jgi:patatin-like phospholipase/acyl hydrolase
MERKESKKLFRILSIDGGGIRGILPGQIVASLEKKLQIATDNPDARIGDFFDLIAGTSTGGILACAYACPDPKNPTRPKFTAQEAVDLYLNFGDRIFFKPFLHKAATVVGLFGPKYPAFTLEGLLKEKLGDVKLSESLNNLIIPAFSMDDGNTKFFTSSDAKGKDYYLWEVARSTSAAPTYFPASHVGNLRDMLKGYIDGGVFANNPTMCALVEAYKVDVELHRKYHVDTARGIGGLSPGSSVLENVFVLSIGTSDHEETYPFEEQGNAGMISWIRPLIDIMMSGVSETVAYQVEQLFRLLRIQQVEATLDSLHSDGTASTENMRNELFEILKVAHDAKDYQQHGETVAHLNPKPQYIRIEPSVGKADGSMDNAKPENLKLLKEAGDAAAKANEQWLDIAVEHLIA